MGWLDGINGHGFGWTPGFGDGQGGLACCNSWGHKESDTTEQLNWTDRWFTSLYRRNHDSIVKQWYSKLKKRKSEGPTNLRPRQGRKGSVRQAHFCRQTSGAPDNGLWDLGQVIIFLLKMTEFYQKTKRKQTNKQKKPNRFLTWFLGTLLTSYPFSCELGSNHSDYIQWDLHLVLLHVLSHFLLISLTFSGLTFWFIKAIPTSTWGIS